MAGSASQSSRIWLKRRAELVMEGSDSDRQRPVIMHLTAPSATPCRCTYIAPVDAKIGNTICKAEIIICKIVYCYGATALAARMLEPVAPLPSWLATPYANINFQADPWRCS